MDTSQIFLCIWITICILNFLIITALSAIIFTAVMMAPKTDANYETIKKTRAITLAVCLVSLTLLVADIILLINVIMKQRFVPTTVNVVTLVITSLAVLPSFLGKIQNTY